MSLSTRARLCSVAQHAQQLISILLAAPLLCAAADIALATKDRESRAVKGNMSVALDSFEFDSAADGGAPIAVDHKLLIGNVEPVGGRVRFALDEMEVFQL